MPGAARRSTRPYGGKSPEERRAERRRRLLDAALQLFGDEPGYRASSVAAVCARADLSTRQFYEEFRNLEDVLVQLHREGNARAAEAAAEALARAADAGYAERAVEAFRAYARVVADDPRRVRVMFVEVVGVSADLERRRLETRRTWAELVLAEVKLAIERGEVPARDYRLTVHAFISAVNGLLYDWSAGYIEATLDEVLDELVTILVGAIERQG